MARSPKGLIENRSLTPEELAQLTPEEIAQLGIRWEQISSGVFQLRGPDVRQEIKKVIAYLRQLAESHIEAKPVTDGTLDRTAAAAALLYRLRGIECFLAAAERNGASGDLYLAVYHSLSLAIGFYQLAIIDNETLIVAWQKSVEGARDGGTLRSKGLRIRNRKMAQEFLNRQGGRMSATALMERIGAGKLKRRAAVNAVKSGLEDLNRGD